MRRWNISCSPWSTTSRRGGGHARLQRRSRQAAAQSGRPTSIPKLDQPGHRWRDDSKPTAGFQRVIQRAVIHVQSSGREEVTGANVLVAIFAERESHAAYFLQEQDMTRYDAVNYISHGIAKRPGASEARPVRGADEENRSSAKRGRPGRRRQGQEEEGKALDAYCVNLNARRATARSIR
jgi:ATP-dependent Clp protease ATP-binding subunit ClpA